MQKRLAINHWNKQLFLSCDWLNDWLHDDDGKIQINLQERTPQQFLLGPQVVEFPVIVVYLTLGLIQEIFSSKLVQMPIYFIRRNAFVILQWMNQRRRVRQRQVSNLSMVATQWHRCRELNSPPSSYKAELFSLNHGASDSSVCVECTASMLNMGVSWPLK